MATESPLDIVPGQFDDALEDAERRDPRQDGHNLNDNQLLEWSESSEDEVDQLSGDDFEDDRVEDEDWEIAERGESAFDHPPVLTYEWRMVRFHKAVQSGNVQGVASSTNKNAAVAPLPAVNHPIVHVHAKDRTATQLAALSKYSSKISRIDQPYAMGVGVNRKGPSSYANAKDKSDRATSEQVLDPRTRVILFKMIGRGLLQEVNGCISTGKEVRRWTPFIFSCLSLGQANVYHALAPDSAHLALKIYKTSILVFKDRDRYVTGEYRFRRGYSRHNPRKMVRLWAEKEMRNLKRLVTAGIYCPEPSRFERTSLASPLLKDAKISESEYPFLYQELVLSMRRMYHRCKLVHADLSEYNIIYHDAHLYIIDVSQSVEHDHPHAFDFLRNDIKNVEEFFGRFGVQCLGLRRCFEFVTKDRLGDNGSEEHDGQVVQRWITEAGGSADEADKTGNAKSQTAHEDNVFLRSYIPRTLNEVYDPERDIDVLKGGEGKKLIYANTIGLVDTDDESPVSDNTSDDDEDQGPERRAPRGHRHEDRELKRQVGCPKWIAAEPRVQERKKAVKAEARERRKNKMPKAEKKRKIKNS
ncbi:RIO1-domain-containing protein [Boletus reticuloceps]|uniref:Serine/threonine-protein kinase RIO1 n=1 Tax=Boletus reticuloceps TaxID=495285 RepID=A0A8I3A9T0_9AGAM|nr:RIO1-domain-containing protein [Boletus reticuloceps]